MRGGSSIIKTPRTGLNHLHSSERMNMQDAIQYHIINSLLDKGVYTYGCKSVAPQLSLTDRECGREAYLHTVG